MYQNPEKFPNHITYIEFDRKGNEPGNDYITYVEWTDADGEEHSRSVVAQEKIPAHIRLQIALQIAGDLIQPIQK